MKKKTVLKEAGVLLIAILIVLSTVAVTANTMNLNKKEENEISTEEAVDSKNTLQSNVKVNSGLAPISIKNPYNIKTDSSSNGGNGAPLLTGVTCYAFDVLSYEGSVWFDSTTPWTLNNIAVMTSVEFISGGTWACGTTWNGWYGCEYNSFFSYGISTGNIWAIDHNFGTMTLVGSYDPGDTGLNFNGLAYEDSSDTMYGASCYDLYTINSLGVPTLKGSFNTGGLMIGIAFDNLGTLYGVDILTDTLYTISTVNGLATPLPNPLGIDLSYAQDMEYDKTNNELYLAAYLINGPPDGPHLYTCDISSGICTLIGAFPSGTEITCFAIPYEPPCDIKIDSIHAGSNGKDVYVDVSNSGAGLIGVPWTMTFTVTGGPGGSPGILGRPPGGVASGTINIPTSGATIYFDDVSGKAEFDLTVTVGCADETISGEINGKKITFY